VTTMHPTLAPWNTPSECDHDGAPDGTCTHCCPCSECGTIRYDAKHEDDEPREWLRRL
jgi:hypothetical protein